MKRPRHAGVFSFAWLWPGIGAALAFFLEFSLRDIGFLPFDDGAYAWAMRHLWEGHVLHKTLPWPHPGYVLWILYPFEYYLSQDIAQYRAPLPFLAAIAGGALAAMLARAGGLAAATGGICVVALGFAQFSTYSASWFTFSLGAAAVALAALARPRTSSWLIAGMLCGLSFGFRGPNGIFALAACSWIIVHQSAPAQCFNARLWSRFFGSCFVALAVLLLVIADDWERRYFALPALFVCVQAVLVLVKRGANDSRRILFTLGIGFLAGVAPLIVWAVWHGATTDLVNDIVRIPAAISQGSSDYRLYGIRDLMTQIMEIFASEHLTYYSLAAVFWFTLFVLAPAFALFLIWRYPSAPLATLAAFALAGVLSLPNFLYAWFFLPFLAAAVIEGFKGHRAATGLVLAASFIALFVAPKGLFPGSETMLVEGRPLIAAPCPVDRCSVRGEDVAMRVFSHDLQAIRNNVLPHVPLIVLKSSADFAYFLENPTPFTLNRYDYLGNYEETARFRQDFMTDPQLVVAVQSSMRGRYNGLLQDYCIYAEDGRWSFLRICEPRANAGL